jgi:hypothetical protein
VRGEGVGGNLEQALTVAARVRALLPCHASSKKIWPSREFT